MHDGAVTDGDQFAYDSWITGIEVDDGIVLNMSPRNTAPYQTLDSSASATSPITVAPGTIQALG